MVRVSFSLYTNLVMFKHKDNVSALHSPALLAAKSMIIMFACFATMSCEDSVKESSGLNMKQTVASPDELGLSPGKERPSALPLNNPSFVVGTSASYVDPDDAVVGVVVRGKPRAYPWWYVINYHVINDAIVINNQPFPGVIPSAIDDAWSQYEHHPPKDDPREPYIPLLITLCEACSGASAYIPVVDGSLDNPLVFAQCRSKGSSAGSYNAIGVYTICDMQSHSRWHPFTGEAKSGPFEGKRLQRIPVSVEKWSDWIKTWPSTVVAVAALEMRMRRHARLGGNFMGSKGMHPTLKKWMEENPELIDSRLPINTLVLGMESHNKKKSLAYPLDALKQAGGVDQREVEGKPYLFVVAGSFRGAVFHRENNGQSLNLVVESSKPLLLKDQTGTVWNELGEAVTGPNKGDRLAVVADSYLAEWSEWIMEHPGADVVN